jgi:hypothetical protein
MLRSALLPVLFFVLAVSSCATPDNNDQSTPSSSTAETAFAKLQTEGITCDVQNDIASFNEADDAAFTQMLVSNMAKGQLLAAIDSREMGCKTAGNDAQTASVTNDRLIEMSTHAVTNVYVVEQIEKVSSQSVGWSPISIYRDGSVYGNMCGNDLIKDYIAEFQGVSSAYSSPGGLRIMGLNNWGDCYLKNPTGARVYSDNSIRACYGYWSVIYCGGALTYDTRVYRAY